MGEKDRQKCEGLNVERWREMTDMLTRRGVEISCVHEPRCKGGKALDLTALALDVDSSNSTVM